MVRFPASTKRQRASSASESKSPAVTSSALGSRHGSTAGGGATGGGAAAEGVTGGHLPAAAGGSVRTTGPSPPRSSVTPALRPHAETLSVTVPGDRPGSRNRPSAPRGARTEGGPPDTSKNPAGESAPSSTLPAMSRA